MIHYHYIPNTTKINRLKHAIVIYKDKINKTHDLSKIGQYKAVIKRRKEAIEFITAARQHISWAAIKKTFHLETNYC